MPVSLATRSRISPSSGQKQHGFSTYTAFPAFIAITAEYAWKWSGVSDIMPSRSPNSSTLRRSFSMTGLLPVAFST